MHRLLPIGVSQHRAERLDISGKRASLSSLEPPSIPAPDPDEDGPQYRILC
jgi:hypothetical protein